MHGWIASYLNSIPSLEFPIRDALILPAKLLDKKAKAKSKCLHNRTKFEQELC